jgi:hypothetical protein
MSARNELFVRPISWSTVNPSASALKRNPTLVPSIQMFGYTNRHQTIYIRIPRNSTFILKFNQGIDDELIANMIDILNPITIKTSQSDSTIMIVRGPEISPFDLTQDDESAELATWQECHQDPYGELQSFWAINQISPYDWLTIHRYRPLSKKYTNSDLDIIASETDIRPTTNSDLIRSDIITELPTITPRLFFWDIETFASRKDEFPNANEMGDFIFMISIITTDRSGLNSYVIVKGSITEDLIQRRLAEKYGGNIPFILIRTDTERELLDRFFILYQTHRPDRQVYYNGDMFDMPYLLDRLSINGMDIPQMSKVLGLPLRPSKQKILTPFGMVDASTINIPGTEIVDLLYFYRRFYPHFRNHKLDTISTSFIGEGKTDLSIDEMMDAIRTDDPEKQVRVVDYSFIDSLRMQQLWEQTKVESKMEKVCNRLGISINNLLHHRYEQIIDHAMYNIDEGARLNMGASEKPTYLQVGAKGIYHNVYVYDYTELYRQLMLRSSQSTVKSLAKRLKGAPPSLIMTAFFSGYVDRSRLLQVLLEEINRFKLTNTIIAIDATTIRTIGKIDFMYLKLVNVFRCYISLGKASYITLEEDKIEMNGMAKLCRPAFALAYDIMNQYVNLVHTNTLDKFEYPNMESLPLDKFVMVEKIEHIQQYDPSSLKFELSRQYGGDVLTWVRVKYVMTMRGPRILSLLTSEDQIDYNYYIMNINQNLTELQSLKNYGI